MEAETRSQTAVVECAGGQVVVRDGQPLRYNREPDILNPHFFVFGDPSRDWLAALNL